MATRTEGDSSDDISSPDLPEVLPVRPVTLALAIPLIDHLPPLSRLAPVEVFRPPRALG